MKHLKGYNESIKDYLKPKPIDGVLKKLEKMDKKEKLEYINRYKLWDVLPNELVRSLLKHYTKDNKLTMIEIHDIDRCYTDEELIDFYKNKRFPESDMYFGLLEFGVKHKRIGIVKHSLDNGVDVNKEYKIISYKNYGGHNQDFIETDKILEFASFMGDIDIVKLLLDRDVEIGDSISIAEKRGFMDIVKLLKDWKNTMNESIKDYLKPKTDEEIQKSLNGLSKEDAYLKFLKYELYELTYKLKNDLKYFKISSDDYNEIHDIYEKNLFNTLEKQNIDNVINKNNSRNNYTYETPNLESSIGEIFCLEIRVNGYIYIIDKYSNYITIYMEKINRYKHYYICPSFKELLQFLDDFMITARRIY